MSDGELDKYLAEGQRILNRLEHLPFPTIALINGDALGGGLEVALACKHRIAADDPSIKLGLPEVTLGLCPGWGGVVRSTKLLGPEKAARLATTGKPIPPAEAKVIGLVDEVAARDQLFEAGKRSIPPPSTLGGGKGEGARATYEKSLPPTPSQGTGRGKEAADRIAQIIRTTLENGDQAGFDAERGHALRFDRSERPEKLRPGHRSRLRRPDGQAGAVRQARRDHEAGCDHRYQHQQPLGLDARAKRERRKPCRRNPFF
jgi:enoyl-CoA hydratase/carnithine racemase